jgi:hypothetical protein
VKRTCTIIIGVADVARSFAWHQSLFGRPESPRDAEEKRQRLAGHAYHQL